MALLAVKISVQLSNPHHNQEIDYGYMSNPDLHIVIRMHTSYYFTGREQFKF